MGAGTGLYNLIHEEEKKKKKKIIQRLQKEIEDFFFKEIKDLI